VRRKESIEKRVGVFSGEVAVEDDIEAEVESDENVAAAHLVFQP
jgi:hypothetical protein